MALFKILKGPQNNLNSKEKIDGQILVCTDTGNIYVDIPNGEEIERIQLNADAATRIRTSNTDDSVDLTYTDIQNLFKTKLNATNPSISGHVTIDRAKLLTDGDTNTLYLNSSSGTGNYQGAIATQNYVNNQISDKWENGSNNITINGTILTANASDGKVGDTLTIATKEYVNDQISDMATQTYVSNQISIATSDMATQSYVSTEIAKYPTILSGTTEPDDSIGKVGDIYIQYTEEA